MPKTSTAWAPTAAAPAVLAIVLSDRMAAMGFSMFVFRSFKFSTPFFSVGRDSMYDEVVEYNVASNREHKKEMPSVNNTDNTSSVMCGTNYI